MEHLAGCNLAEWLAQEGRVPFRQAVDVVLPVCEVLAEAHSLDYVHRDLKPENLFIVRKAGMADVVKVLDFGIAKVKSSPSLPEGESMLGTPCTEPWTVMGSPRYMAPEQMESARDVDARADIWALGAILYELIAGTVPYAGKSLIEIYSKIATLPPPPLCPSLGCPAPLEAIIARCLARWPAGRYSDVAELALALVQFGSDRFAPSIERTRCSLARDVRGRAAFGVRAQSVPESRSVSHARWPPSAETPSSPADARKSRRSEGSSPRARPRARQQDHARSTVAPRRAEEWLYCLYGKPRRRARVEGSMPGQGKVAEPRGGTGERAVVIAVRDPIAQGRVAESVRRQGRRALPVSIAEEAREALAHERLDLVVIDGEGLGLLEAFRGGLLPSETPALAITDPEDVDRRREALRAGATDFLSLRFDDVELDARIHTLCELGRLRRSSLRDASPAATLLPDDRLRYREVVESQTEMVARWTFDKGVTLANPALLRALGLSAGEVLGRTFEPFVFPDDFPALRAHLAAVRIGAPVGSIELRLRRPDGEVRWTEWTNRGVFDDAGVLVEFQSVGHDITERKRLAEERQRAEVALRASEERNRAFVAAIPDLLFRLDADGRFVDCAISDPSLLALPPAAFIGKTVGEVFAEEVVGDQFGVPGSFSRELVSSIGRARETRALQRFEYTFRDRWFEARVVPCGPSEVLAIARDITALKSATHELERSRARFAFLVNESPAVIYTCTTTPPYAATFVSANVLEQMGHRPEEFVADPGFWLRNVHPDDAPSVLAALPRLFETGSHEHEYRFRGKNDEYRWMHDKVRLVRDGSGRNVELIGFWLDVTESKHADDALREAVQARETLLAIVSHDLRNPLSSIHFSANLLSRSARAADPSTSRKPIDTILRASEQMRRLIDDLLDAATIERAAFTLTRAPEEPAKIVDEALEAIEPAATKKGVRLKRSVPPDLPTIDCDRLRVLQVLSNLLGNAVRLVREGKAVEVRARPLPGCVEFVVADEGPGIPEEHVSHVFDRYWTGHAQGRTSAGLGLFIAKGIVDAHGGRLWVETRSGAGAAFFFTIPIA